MSGDRPPEYLRGLVRELCKLPRETEWVEFKVDDVEPKEIGEYVSALANSAALFGKAQAYLVWGIEDAGHAIVGTRFQPADAKVGNEELENWLLHLLNPKLQFRFFTADFDGRRVVLLEIERAFRHPVQFQGQEYIRVGSYKKKLKDHPERERALWRAFDRKPFEDDLALGSLTDQDVLRLLDYPAYFDLLSRPLPSGPAGILEQIEADQLVRRDGAGGFGVTNLGAVLFAKRLADFPGLARKAVRVIRYYGNSRTDETKEHPDDRGYANGFQALIARIMGLLPPNEAIRQALRTTRPLYPELAIRELVANALIHQDLFVTGRGPMVEVFDDRLEVTNAGAPLVDAERFLDLPPRSRNERLASLMRRLGICEERGSGIDKVVFQVEFFQLPAPRFDVPEDSTRAVLLGPRALAKMGREDRIRACYWHACLRWVNGEYLTNTSLRERFGIATENSASASRLIREAVDGGVIAPFDASAAPKLMKYVPWWAKRGEEGT